MDDRADTRAQFERIAGMLEDLLTAQRREEEASARFRALVERSPDVFLVVSRDAAVSYASPALAVVLGYRPDELAGRDLLDFVHPDDGGTARAAVAGAGEAPGSAAPVELRLRHRDGTWRVLEASTAHLGRGPDAVLLVGREATERRRRTEALRLSEERHALALEGVAEGLFDWDLGTDRVHYSPRWKSILGHADREVGETPEEWLGRVHADDAARVRADLDAHLEGRSPRLESEHRVKAKDGDWRAVLVRAVAIRDGEGRAVRLVGTHADITGRKEAESRLLHQAIHDALTGLPNRMAFMERLERSLERTRRARDYSFAVLFVDIDRFKLVNESLGHVIGDQLLVALSKRLTAALRPGDMVAHLGGDEFAVLVDRIHADLASTQVARRIQKDLAQPFDLGAREVFVSASIGIALSTAGYLRPEDMLHDADSAMHRAKARGSGRFEMFDREMHARSLARLQLETDLRRALERREFRLHYQPIVALPTGRISGFEALLRWQHPERGLLPPADFLSVAEETGLIVPIGSWVLHEACGQARAWQNRFGPDALTMSANLASTNFAQSDVIQAVEQALLQTGFPGRHLKLELTESAIMKDLEAVVRVLLALKKMEIGLHIDDFGTGYSSLSYLHSLPTDTLKVDRSFVGGMEERLGDVVIVRSIVELAHNLDRQVVAEGVETAVQLDQLRALDCEFGQGFFFSRPLEKEAAEALLVTGPRW
jgi:diguanylate cyclase (GGDEF)-like protein/PAS domain S-box-containing protein